MLIQFEGLVLRVTDYGESHQIVTVFTKPYGRISFVARGSKKTRSRFGSVTEPFTVAQFLCFQSNTRSMPTLSQADSFIHHYEIRSDLLLSSYGAYWFDLVLNCCPEKEPFPTVYQLLLDALEQLVRGKDPDILTRILELRLMGIAGYRPNLKQCVRCKSTHRPVFFSIHQGGVLCEKCSSLDSESFLISEIVHRILLIFQEINLNQLGEIRVKENTKRELERILTLFIDNYLDHTFRSRRILQQIKDDFS